MLMGIIRHKMIHQKRVLVKRVLPMILCNIRLSYVYSKPLQYDTF